MSASRLAWLVLTACHHGAPPPASVPLQNTAAPAPATSGLQLLFGTAEPMKDRAHHQVMFTVEHKLAVAQVPVLEVARGSIVYAPIQIVEEDVGESGHEVAYAATLPGTSGEELYDDVVILAPTAGFTAVPIAPADERELAGLKHPGFAAVTQVKANGIDLDGDRRPDVAIIQVCIESRRDADCDSRTWFAVQRTPAGWHLTTFCTSPLPLGCTLEHPEGQP